MIGPANANALTAAGMAAYAAAELRFHGLHDNNEGIRETAAETVAPLLRAAAIALELSGLVNEEQSSAVHDIIVEYISVPIQPADPARVAVS
jgi:hypothetical protein